MNRTILLITSFLIGAISAFAQAAFNTPGAGNPVIPGYFADPTIKKFGDTYYMYATTDGSGAGWCQSRGQHTHQRWGLYWGRLRHRQGTGPTATGYGHPM